MKTDFIAAEIRDELGIVTLNNPNTFNSINEKMLKELDQQLMEYDQTEKVKVIVLKGLEQSFAAGLDVKDLAENLNDAVNIIQNMQYYFQTIQSIQKPLIAAVSGFALGIGCELALSCDIILATDQSRFGLPELSIGLLPCFGGCGLLSTQIGKAKTMDIILSGRALSAEEAEQAGLISRVVTASALAEEYTKLARRLSAFPKKTVVTAKKIISSYCTQQSFSLENQLSLNQLDSEEFKQSLRRFAQKKPSESEKA